MAAFAADGQCDFPANTDSSEPCHGLGVVNTNRNVFNLMLDECPQATGAVAGRSAADIIGRLDQHGEAVNRLN